MAEGGEGAQYSRLTGSKVEIFLDTRHTFPFAGLIYIFNLIVGTGALTLPAAFKDAGYLCSTVILFTFLSFLMCRSSIPQVILILLAFMSFLTATFVIESMAAANALLAWRQVFLKKKTHNDCQNT